MDLLLVDNSWFRGVAYVRNVVEWESRETIGIGVIGSWAKFDVVRVGGEFQCPSLKSSSGDWRNTLLRTEDCGQSQV